MSLTSADRSTPISTPSQTTQYTPSTAPTANTFLFPPYTQFPPFYTLQPNLQTRVRQLELWSALLTSYFKFNTLFRLNLSSPPPDLFTNAALNRSLKPSDQRILLDHLSKPENGSVVEYIPPTSKGKGEQSTACYVWWRSAQEWANLLASWVDETGQEGTVLTLYELREGDAVRGKEWREMDEGMLRKVLGVLVKRGKAQVFGQDGGGEGVKFF